MINRKLTEVQVEFETIGIPIHGQCIGKTIFNNKFIHTGQNCRCTLQQERMTRMIKTDEKFDKSTPTYVCVKIGIFYMAVLIYIYVYTQLSKCAYLY